MKRCPKCGKRYDDSWKVCLSDSTPLVNTTSGEAETINLLQPTVATHKESIEKMASFIGQLISSFSVVLLPLNLLAGIVGGIWLLFLGEWRLVLAGFLFSVSFPMAYGFTVGLFSLPIVMLGDHLYNKKKASAALFVGFINITLTNLIHLAIIIIAILVVLLARDGKMMLPFLLFGYSVIVEPFQYMAAHEPSDAYGTWIGLFFIQVAYIIMAIALPIRIGIIGLLITVALMFYLITFQMKLAKFEIKQEPL